MRAGARGSVRPVDGKMDARVRLVSKMEPARFLPNERKRALPPEAAPTRAALEFHRGLEGYAPTPLRELPELARVLGVGQVLLKDESSRLGLPAFKILGASWAIERALRASAVRPEKLATATDGNHGRAVAHRAAQLGLSAHIFVPAGTARARIEAIAGEGAEVTIVDGSYDDAVARAAEEASARCLVISDTSWPGYTEVPRWVAEGYSTILWEIDDELARRGERGPDLVAVQFGVGALAAAVARHYRAPGRANRPQLLSVEPLTAACALAAAEAGEIVTVPGPHRSIMAGLNCGRVSEVAWPLVSAGFDAFVALDDARAREALRLLAGLGITGGETGVAGLAGVLECLTGPARGSRRAALEVNEGTRVLLFLTEGATDPEAHRRLLVAGG